MQGDSLPPPPIEELPVVVPPPVPQREEVLATPGDLPADADGKLPFWRPTWGEVAMGLGWRWLFVGPAILVMLGMMGLCVGQLAFFQWYWLPWEWMVVLLMGVIGGVVGVIRAAIRSRRDPFCIHCGYTLEGLPDEHRCPECGRPYTFALIRKYQQDPRWFAQCWENERVQRKYGRMQGTGQ